MTEDVSGNGTGAAASADEQGQDSLEAARQEAADNWEKYVRIAAELDNLRKRNAREVENARKFGAERLAQALLPVRDSLDAALALTGAGDAQTLLEGQRAILRLLDEAFAAAGVKVVDPIGEPFDPAKHEAIGMLPSPDAAPGSVLEVMQKGYELNDRLLRPARVMVARAPDDGAA